MFTMLGYGVNIASVLGVVAIIWSLIVLIKRRSRIWKSPLFILFALFIGVASLSSIIQSITIDSSLREMIRIMSIFGLFSVAFELIRSRRDVRRYVIAIVISLIAPIIFSLIQVITGTGLDVGNISNRVFGTFAHPNVLAFYIVFSVGILLSILSSNIVRISRWIIITLLASSLLVILLTYTRSAWIGTGILLILFGIIRYRRILLVSIIILILAIPIFALLNSYTTREHQYDLNRTSIIQRITGQGSEDRNSLEWRFKVWNEMSRKFYEQPFIGHGLGSFIVLRSRQTKDIFVDPEAHNDYLRLAIETGVVGIASYILLLITLLTFTLRALIRSWHAQERWTAFGALGGIIAFIVMSFFDNLLQATAVMWLFWTSIPVLLIHSSQKKGASAPSSR